MGRSCPSGSFSRWPSGFSFFAGLAAAGAGGATAAIIGLPAAHSFGFLVNGQLWVCVRYCRFYDRDPRALERFLDRATVTLRRCPWLEEALCIGSQGAGRGAYPAFRHRSAPDLPAWSRRLGPDEPAAATAARLGPLCPHSTRPLRLQLAAPRSRDFARASHCSSWLTGVTASATAWPTARWWSGRERA